MFVSHAHSFRQQARLAISLALVGGYTNITTIIICGTATSHASGTTTNFGRDIFSGNWSMAAFAFFLLFTFFIGAMISGICTELGRRRGWESIFVLPIAIEALLLGLFALTAYLIGAGLSEQPDIPLQSLLILTGLASAAMGLQNATITKISNGLVRTTHVTGVLTDLGYEFVLFLWWIVDLRRNVPPNKLKSLLRSVYKHPPGRRLLLLLSIIASFALGAGLGTLGHREFPRWAMVPPFLCLWWMVFQDIVTPIAEIESSELNQRAAGLDLPKGLAIFHLRKDHSRRLSRFHRMPNLTAWADRLSGDVRVIILDLGVITDLDSNNAAELRSLFSRLREHQRDIIISGMNIGQLHALDITMADSFHAENVCPDLELAIALGMNRLEQMISAASTTQANG